MLISAQRVSFPDEIEIVLTAKSVRPAVGSLVLWVFLGDDPVCYGMNSLGILRLFAALELAQCHGECETGKLSGRITKAAAEEIFGLAASGLNDY
ncbi:hypothetical protein OZX73_05145 [Bifidobacterium sp. ESL0775]|uniref:hypothetical protein n=1 Tax=Bifidobacterium sp. ESL0775 TaxID=2983230 RepID=UPI0023F7F444|nr:hypothetical protein [Bifidobacterium sp. ESL0775]WEV68678.1 hypothetical protein OZX73_05145 [Bifidobacterium sp. ESL0775]